MLASTPAVLTDKATTRRGISSSTNSVPSVSTSLKTCGIKACGAGCGAEVSVATAGATGAGDGVRLGPGAGALGAGAGVLGVGVAAAGAGVAAGGCAVCVAQPTVITANATTSTRARSLFMVNLTPP